MGRYITFLLLLCVSSNTYTQTLIDSVIAVVNTDAITYSDLENEFRIAVLMGTRSTGTPTVAEKRAALKTIIDRKFVLQESERLGIVVTERGAQVGAKVAEIRTKYPSDAAFQSVLQQYELEDETLETWIYEQLIYDEFFRRRFFNVINSAETARLAKSYYDANMTEFVVPPTVTFNSLSIVIPKDGSAEEKQAVEDLVLQLSVRLQEGETFASVRESYEKRLTLRLEVLTLAVDTPLGTIVKELPTSERSAPLPVSEGYQIVEYIRNDPSRQKEYSEISEEITERIRQELAESQFEVWLTGQKEAQTWHILDDELAQAESKSGQTDVE